MRRRSIIAKRRLSLCYTFPEMEQTNMAPTFRNDYNVLVHPRILAAISTFANEKNIAYGEDIHSQKAAEYLKKTFGAPKANVYFLAGGTQTNLVFVSYALRPYEGVISADTGHINVHETAAIEGAGHKIIPLPNHNGKITADQIAKAIRGYDNEHMVKPGMVYLSNSTEMGTIYGKKELEEIARVCKENGLYLYLDGARIGNALTAKSNDLSPEDLGRYCDAFYIGGTKNGLLLGEALVVNNPALNANFRYHIKNKGAMLAKGFLVGIEFEEAFKDGLYFDLARHANAMADRIKEGFLAMGLDLLDSPTNQIFVSFPREEAEEYLRVFDLEKWSEEENAITVRFVTSFATSEEDVNALLNYLSQRHQ